MFPSRGVTGPIASQQANSAYRGSAPTLASNNGSQSARTMPLSNNNKGDRSTTSLHSYHSQQDQKEAAGQGHSHHQGGGYDYSSTGASVEETRPERYTVEFVRALTPRSLHACAENGILARELLYRPESSFDGSTVIASTSGIIAEVHDGSNSKVNNVPASAIVQHLRWKDYETSRLVALDRVRVTRRRHISGLRHTLFGIQTKERTTTGRKSSSPTSLPHVSGSQTARLPGAGKRSTAPSLYPKEHEIKEHPFFANHPQHARLHGLQHSGGMNQIVAGQVQQVHSHGHGHSHSHSHSLPAQALEWNMLSPPSSDGRSHLCLRMREHLLREQERLEWERLEDEREAREKRRREQRENEWYQEKKLQMKRGRKKKTQSMNGTNTEQSFILPKLTRAEMLRAAGANSLFQTQQQQQVGGVSSGPSASSGGGDQPPRRMSVQIGSSGTSGGPSAGNTTNQLPPTIRERSTESKEPSIAAGANNGGTNNNNPTGGSKSQQSAVPQPHYPGGGAEVPLSATFTERHHASVAATAQHYASFFEKEKAKIVARQENEIARLAAQERYRFELLKKQDELSKRRAERLKAEKVRREQIAQEHQRLRESKFARVETEEAQRVYAIEQALLARLEKSELNRLERERQIHLGIRERQTHQEALDEERKWKIEQAHENSHRLLVENLKMLHERYELARVKMIEERERIQAERHAKGATLEQKLQTALERQHEECERKYKLHLARTEKHALRDTSVMVKKAQEVAAQRREKQAEKEAQKQLVLDAKNHERTRRIEQILSKDQRDAARLKEIEYEKSQALLLSIEKKRLEEQRKQRNLEREERKVQFHHQQLAAKLESDLHRLQTIHALKTDYVQKREAFQKKSFNATREFRETYTKLRTGALKAIVLEAKQRQRDIDRAKEEEEFA